MSTRVSRRHFLLAAGAGASVTVLHPASALASVTIKTPNAGTVLAKPAVHDVAAKKKREKDANTPPPNFIIRELNGTIIKASLEDKRRHPASTTKMALLHAVMDTMGPNALTFNLASAVEIPKAVKGLDNDLYRLNLQPGKTYRAIDLMIACGSYSCASSTLALTAHLGRYLSGDTEYDRIDAAVEHLNEMAQMHGMENTNFCNTIGTPDKKHYSTVTDMARMSEILHRDFPATSKRIMGQPYTSTEVGGGVRGHTSPWVRSHPQDTLLLKTGSTTEAGRCYAGAVTAKGQKFAVAIFGGTSGQNRETIMTDLYNAAANHAVSQLRQPLKIAPEAANDKHGIVARIVDKFGLLPR